MPWARIDDDFEGHPKVQALLNDERGAAAIGLWTLCLSWAHKYTRKPGKTLGLLPPNVPRRYLGPVALELAGLLVKEGMWESMGDAGWRIHDFEKYLPSRAMSTSRAAAGSRGGRQRARNAGQKLRSSPGEASSLELEASSLEPQARAQAKSKQTLSKAVGVIGSSSTEGSSSVGGSLTITQRAKRITDSYAAAEPMCKWPAVNGVVIRAIKTERWRDTEIRDALLRMAAENRSVTIDSLRIELSGFTPRTVPRERSYLPVDPPMEGTRE